MHSVLQRSVVDELSLALVTGEGRFIARLEPEMPQDAVKLAHAYSRTQPQIAIDLRQSRVVAISFRLGSEASYAQLEAQHGKLEAPTREVAEYAHDGVVKLGRHVREVRLARVSSDVARTLTDVTVDAVEIRTTGLATMPAGAIADLPEAWITYIADVPRMQAARAQAEREEAELWRQGRHPSQQPNPNSKRLLEAFRVQHNSALLDLAAGAIIDDPQLLGALEHAGALIGSLDDMPRARNLQPGEARFRSSFRAAMGVGGWRSYREGDTLTNVTMTDVNELRHAGAVIDFGGDVIAANPEFFSNPTPLRGSRKTA